ncbi:ABC transporter type 1, transmembrane domain-containing protein [Fimicolochytrium jonesii]|uniref:ABC transporter type 1, transmembrane domain-containing protein n=1 Tax=Fimicolochytrium jonesii TaxID=1396493 RepID=UPI0022FE66BE|nr:ABC transporter type 1, transmembrane domain-containing protein [Fimicolochytrium jonesii]KAI8821981.1 ABC transporter type 1, transmembrane domain-containing protein [Fimicolochytrium jonesii]
MHMEGLCGDDPWGPWRDGALTECFVKTIVIAAIPTLCIVIVGSFSFAKHLKWREEHVNDNGIHRIDEDHDQSGDTRDDFSTLHTRATPHAPEHAWVWAAILNLANLQIAIALIEFLGVNTLVLAPYEYIILAAVLLQWTFFVGILAYLIWAPLPYDDPEAHAAFDRSKRTSLRYLLAFVAVAAIAKVIELVPLYSHYDPQMGDVVRILLVIGSLALDILMLAFGLVVSGEMLGSQRFGYTSVPSSESRQERVICTEEGAPFFSKMTFMWFNDLIKLGASKHLSKDDIPDIAEGDKAANVCERFEKIRLRHKGLLASLYYLVRKELRIQAAYGVGSTLLFFAGPFFLNRILAHVSQPRGTSSAAVGLSYAFALLVCSLVRSACDGQLYFIGRRIGLRLRAVLITEIYTKALRRRAMFGEEEEDQGATTGQVQNLMAVDCQKILEMSCYLQYYWSLPSQIIICVVLLCLVLGWPALTGVAVMLSVMPIGAYFGKAVARAQKSLIRATDKRINAINEALQGIRVLKFFSWELHYYKQLTKYRDTELKKLRHYIFVAGGQSLLWSATPIMVSFLTFLTYTKAANRELTAEVAFTGLALFNALRGPLQYFPEMIVRLSEVSVSMQRIKEFLAEEELERYEKGKEVATTAPLAADQAIGIHGGSFTWEADETETTKKRKRFSLKNLELSFPPGQLSLVCGTTGSGKTSLMMALLGEMHRIAGTTTMPDSRTAKVEPITRLAPSVAYAAQQAWLMNGTVRDNITFGEPFDSERYEKVIFACALTRDLETFNGGDMCEIGEKGINVSGGQKARLSLARAAYSRAAYVLLDDPLSAVDAPTARHLFEECILGLLRDRTRVLVTHAVHLCIPRADHVIVMGKGVIATQGSPKEVIGKGPGKIDLETIIDDEDELQAVAEVNEDGDDCGARASIGGEASVHSTQRSQGAENDLRLEVEENSPSSGSLGKGAGLPKDATITSPVIDRPVARLTEDEAKASGSVGSEVYMTYIRAAGGFLFVLTLAITYSGTQLAIIGQDWWLKHWAQAYKVVSSLFFPNGALTFQAEERLSFTRPQPINVDWYLEIYALIGVLSLLALLIRIVAVAMGSLKASKRLHNAMLTSILRAPIRFFDITPLGRILNRFSRDTQCIDQEVSNFSGEFLRNSVSAIAVVLVVASVTPLFVGALIPIALIYRSVARLYLSTSRELKRYDSVTRSPIYSHFSETITGAPTIRAYGAEQRFTEEIYARIDQNHRPFFYLWVSNRWLGIRIDFVGAAVSFSSAAAILATMHWGPGMDPGAAGLSLSYALTFTDNLLWVVRMHSLMEMTMNSVERIGEYLEIDEEAPAVIDTSRPPTLWPQAGRVVFTDVVVKYAPALPPVLRGLSFTGQAGEKIGIVGRTGAGKSTISLALFRFLEASSGRIVIDGIDIAQIGLHDLRSRLTIIAQDPILFTGTLRSNLDPFSQHTDLELWTALRRSHLLDSDHSRHSHHQQHLPTAVPVSIAPHKSSGNNSGSEGGSMSTSQLVHDRTGSLVTRSFGTTPSTSRRPSLTPATFIQPANDTPSGHPHHHALHRQTSTASVGSNAGQPHLTLDTAVAEGGANFSQGQRQLLCLARALLRSCKVIVLDEATASVDHETDAKIQETIRNEFRGATLLCVAHRLRTVADYDKILVLSEGKAAEFDTPSNLMKLTPERNGGKPGIFRSMCEESGEVELLLQMANKADEERVAKRRRSYM